MGRRKWGVAVLVFFVFGATVGALLVTSGMDWGPAMVLTSPPTPVQSTPEPSMQATETPTEPPPAGPTKQPKELAICQSEEPNTLFVYGGPSRTARGVLEALYDGPIDTRRYQFQPVILERLPSLENGDIAIRSIDAREGDSVVDVNEYVVDLLPNVTVYNADGVEVVYESGVLTMTQMMVTFTLRSDLTWSDGTPLTAEDFLYSYQLAGEFDAPNLQFLRERTQAYTSPEGEAHTLIWTGVPGYRDVSYSYFYFLNAFPPLPKHVWGTAQGEQLLGAEVARRKPLGWGAFVVEEWVAGEHITLVRNPHYFRAAEGLPYLDRITFRFVSDLQQAVDKLVDGECDLITQDVIEGHDPSPLWEAYDAGAIQLPSSPRSEWEHLDFGIQSVQWYEGENFFGDKRVRQAVAQCVDRERIAQEVFLRVTAPVAESYVAADHPLYAGNGLNRWTYDPAQGRALLEEIGWIDQDEDGIREANGVPGFYSGLPFTVTLYTTADDPIREQAAGILVENLADCGIGVVVQTFPDAEFFADGPDGPVLGRQFDLALFSWLNGIDAPCWLYLSSEIPGPENWWATSNNPGYSSEPYDAACKGALAAMPGTNAYARLHREAQRIFSEDLPVLPLYFVPKMVAARPGVEGVVLAPGEYLELWNIEAFDLAEEGGQ